MKKITGFLMAVMLLMAIVSAPVAQAGGYYPKTLTVAAGDTNKLDYIDLSTTAIGCQELDRVVVKHVSGTATGTVYIAAFDLATGTEICNSGALVSGAFYNAHPKYGYGIAGIENVVTGGVLYAVANVTSNAEPYTVRLLKLNVIQGVSATADTYTVGVFTK